MALPGKPNRLIREKSPYLLQHAHNPVDWYPWGPEAFERARREDKPILLSIGYSTCHWCHVMERESFEDPAVAEAMNRHLVCVKLDREERPDVDRVYMSAVQAMTGAGGWPLNVFLTPDLKPFIGGTYFPPDDRWGRPGWKRIVESIGRAWADPEQRRQMAASGESLMEALSQQLSGPAGGGVGGAGALPGAIEDFRTAYDPDAGGFSRAPKFPMPVHQQFLLRYAAYAARRPELKEPGDAARGMALHTLRRMARGGIYDHLGGGFARYSTDARWHVPHFEKMLYDNAQLAANFIDAWQASGDEGFARVARETLDYVLRDMTHPDGGFYSAEDADSLPAAGADRKSEGAFYVWEQGEIEKVLGERDSAVFNHHYGVEPRGNAREDPHGEFTGKNILYAAHTEEETADRFDLTEEEAARLLQSARQRLLEARAARPRPHLDDKVLASWNGLMISALARGAQALGSDAYLAAAAKAAGFLRERLWDVDGQGLFRRWREGERQVAGMADDYAFLAQGLIDLYEAGFDDQWLEWAVELTEQSLRRFGDGHGGFYMAAEGQDGSPPLRARDDADNVEPSAASVSALNLLRLSELAGRRDFQEAAERTLSAFGGAMAGQPQALSAMLCALLFSLEAPVQVVVAGRLGAEDTRRLLETVHARFLPHKVLLFADGGPAQARIAERLPFLKNMAPLDGRAAAYVCRDHACQLPTSDPQALAARLTDIF